MMKRFIYLIILLIWGLALPAQTIFKQAPEFQLAYFGETFAHPGIKAGIHFPFLEASKIKDKSRRKRGSFTKTKFRQYKIGGNIAFYEQGNNHRGYLANVELTYQRTKSKSFKENKLRHFEAAIGIGYYRYQLKGTTFATADNSFQETKGNGNALMPSLSIGWGRNLRFIKQMDIRYFSKSSFYFESPHGIGILPHFVWELGIATSSLSNFKKNKS